MTDNEIIKALECCKSNIILCNSCPIDQEKQDAYTCGMFLAENALDLINRQKAEIENYKQIAEYQQSATMNKGFENRELRREIEQLYKTLDYRAKKITELEAEIERLNGCVKSEEEVREIMKSQMTPMVKEIVNEQFDVAVKLARAEAIKEFADRLKCVVAIHNGDMWSKYEYIDNLVKEMVGDVE